MKREITLKDLKRMLWRYYTVLDSFKKDGINETTLLAIQVNELLPSKSSSEINNMPGAPYPDETNAEKVLIHYIDELNMVRDVHRSMHQLSIQQQVFIDYRFNQHWSTRKLVKEMRPHNLHTSEAGIRRFEKTALKDFAFQMNYILVSDSVESGIKEKVPR